MSFYQLYFVGIFWSNFTFMAVKLSNSSLLVASCCFNPVFNICVFNRTNRLKLKAATP